MSFSDIVNNLDMDLSKVSYLELGSYKKHTFDRVRVSNKKCVDILPDFSPTFCMDTSSFFKINTDIYDIVFIDANHDLAHVVEDFNSSAKVCRKLIAIHDMYPPSKELTDTKFCSDSFKLLYHMFQNNFQFITLDGDYGLTLVFPPFREVDMGKVENVSYEDFLLANIKTYSIDDIISITNRRFTAGA